MTIFVRVKLFLILIERLNKYLIFSYSLHYKHIFIYFTINIIASEIVRRSFSLAPFCCSSARFVYFRYFLRFAFSAYERYIEVTRHCMYFVSGLFSCVPGKRGKWYLALPPSFPSHVSCDSRSRLSFRFTLQSAFWDTL